MSVLILSILLTWSLLLVHIYSLLRISLQTRQGSGTERISVKLKKI